MPALVPFRGVRYAVSRAGLSRLIAPPYDVISAGQRAALGARSPHNIIHLDLPEDTPEETRYARAGRLFREWLASGVMKVDPRPALYPLEQSFTGPDGRPLSRRGVIAAVRLHDYKEGIVVPHEKTFTAPKADRLELLKSTRANFSPVFGFFHDPGARALTALYDATPPEPVCEAESDDGVQHRLWRIEDPVAIAALQGALAGSRVFIADGHHRYETRLAYRDLVDREHPGLPDDAGHRYGLMFLCSMSDPGLVIYPTHRLVRGLPGLSVPALLEKLERYFVVDTLAEDIRRPAGRAWAVARLAEHGGKSTAFLMVTAPDQKARILTLRDDADLAGAQLPRNEILRALDVTVLHALVLRHVLGLAAAAQEEQGAVEFVKDAGEAVSRTLSGECQVGFLLNPTPMWQVQAVSEAGETMPQKSTFFYPKLASGLVVRTVDGREAAGQAPGSPAM